MSVTTASECQPAANRTSVSIRPDKGNWVTVVLFCVFGLVEILAPILVGKGSANNFQQVFLAVLGLVFFVPALLFGYWQARAVIIADENGLRWRGMGGWRTARWPEVSDYYEKLVAKVKPILVIETKAGRIQLGRSLWPTAPELRTQIERKAIQARTKEWGILGMRPETDWPRTFDYHTLDNRFSGTILPSIGIALMGFLLWNAIPGIQRTIATLGWRWGLASFGIFCFGYIPLALLLAVVFQLQRSTTYGRNRQKITLRQEGPVYEDGGQRIEARWNKISDLLVERNGRMSYHNQVVTSQGTFDFTPTIKDYRVLCGAFAKNAVSLPEAKWRTTETNTLGGEASRWTSGCEGVGKRVYHYRTRTNRALLWFPTALALTMICLQCILAPLGLFPSDPRPLIFLTVLAAWGWWRYGVAAIETDADGITQRTLMGTHHLAWSQVEDYSKIGGDVFLFGVVQGARTRLWFWTSIGDVEELGAEIQRQARNSRRQTWDKDAVND